MQGSKKLGFIVSGKSSNVKVSEKKKFSAGQLSHPARNIAEQNS